MGTFVRRLVAGFSVLALSGALSACFVRSPERQDVVYRDTAYRRARWHHHDVYQREDGRWYERRHGHWVLIDGLYIQ